MFNINITLTNELSIYHENTLDLFVCVLMHSNTNPIPSTQNEFYINAQAKRNTVYTSLSHLFKIVPLHNHDIVFICLYGHRK